MSIYEDCWGILIEERFSRGEDSESSARLIDSECNGVRARLRWTSIYGGYRNTLELMPHHRVRELSRPIDDSE